MEFVDQVFAVWVCEARYRSFLPCETASSVASNAVSGSRGEEGTQMLSARFGGVLGKVQIVGPAAVQIKTKIRSFFRFLPKGAQENY